MRACVAGRSRGAKLLMQPDRSYEPRGVLCMAMAISRRRNYRIGEQGDLRMQIENTHAT